DMQGIDWSKLGNTWEGARSVRKLYHQHPMVRQHPQPLSATELPDTEEFFQFRQMNMEHRAWIDHYQLRNLMVSTSHSDVYYVARSRIMHTNSSSVRASCVMDLTDPWTSSSIQAGEFRVTALASAADILVAGGYRGEYALQNLRSEYGTSPVKGFATHNRAAITNHLHTSTTRTNGSPQAIFCSNDKQVRVLDCFTDTFVNEVQYEDYVNCAATSPNGRLRLLVGDFEGSMIVDADSGRLLKHLDGHINNAFACAWADDDIHVATAAEDCHILVWDARNWSKPLGDIANETSHTTSLHFSPLGSGKRLLIAAESADIVNVIDANTYSSKQVLPFFGDIAGVSISVDGSQLLVANGDRKFGGLITYQRDDYG
ncbi:WD40 repeat-like protein, partial [Tothia fuscella]